MLVWIVMAIEFNRRWREHRPQVRPITCVRFEHFK